MDCLIHPRTELHEFLIPDKALELFIKELLNSAVSNYAKSNGIITADSQMNLSSVELQRLQSVEMPM